MDSDAAFVSEFFLMSYAAQDQAVLDGVIGEMDILDSHSSQLSLDRKSMIILEHVHARLPIAFRGGNLARGQLNGELSEVVADVPEPIVSFPAAHKLEFTGRHDIMRVQ